MYIKQKSLFTNGIPNKFVIEHPECADVHSVFFPQP